MQAELEQWIIDNRDHHGFCNVICEDDLRKLLEGKVLCDAEPAGYMFRPDAQDLHVYETTRTIYSVDPRGAWVPPTIPLYTPADIGKEGGE
jgi:hypothetical protein